MICNPSERSWKAVYKMSVFVRKYCILCTSMPL